MKRLRVLDLAWILLLLCTATPARSELGPDVRMMGLDPASAGASIAFPLHVAEGQVVSGLRWANNDGDVVFPSVSIWSGVPGRIDANRILVAHDVRGASQDWSQFDFDSTIVVGESGLVVVFEFPQGSRKISNGLGGGAAIGARIGEAGQGGWVSSDGLEWMPISSRLTFEAETIMLLGRAMGFDSDGAGGASLRAEPEAPDLTTGLVSVGPNPSNPSTTLRFQLARPEVVGVAIHDQRGRLVRSMQLGSVSRGEHAYTWDGLDERGRFTSSGIYYVRLRLGDLEEVRKVTLVR